MDQDVTMSVQLLLLAMSVLSSMLLGGCGGALWADLDADGIESSRALRQKKKKKFPLQVRNAIDHLAECLAESLEAGTRLCIDAAPVSTDEYQPSFQAPKSKGSKDAEDCDSASAIQEVANWLQAGTSMCIDPKPVVSASLAADQFKVDSVDDSQQHFKFDIKAVSDIFDYSSKHSEHGDFVGKDENVKGFLWNTVIMRHVHTGKEVIGNLMVDRTSPNANNDNDNDRAYGSFGCFLRHSEHPRCKDSVDLSVGDLKAEDVLQIVSVCARDFAEGAKTNDDVDLEKWPQEMEDAQCIDVRRP